MAKSQGSSRMNADGGQAAGKPPKTKNLPQSHLEIPKQPNDVYNLPSQHHNHQQQQQQLQSQLLGSSGGKGNAATSGTDALNNAPSYRWVGAGTNLSDGTIEYYTLEVNAAGRVSSVRVGDSVLLFSGDLQDEGVEVDSNAVNEDDKEHAKFEKGPLSETSLPSGDGRDSNNVVSSLALSKKVNQDGSAGISDGSDVNIDENFFGVKALNPFVARIERMWEEPALGKTGRHRNPPGTTFCGFVTDNARKLRMKIKARWYFKREDIVGVNGQFVGMTKKGLLNALGPRDLVLSEQTDDNEVPTVLGKCRVVRRSPTEAGGTKKEKEFSRYADLPRGAFVSEYNIRIPSKGDPFFGSVVIESCNGEEGRPEGVKHQPATSRKRARSLSGESDVGQKGKKIKQRSKKFKGVSGKKSPDTLSEIDSEVLESTEETTEVVERVIASARDEVVTSSANENDSVHYQVEGALSSGRLPSENYSSVGQRLTERRSASESDDDANILESDINSGTEDGFGMKIASEGKEIGVIHIGERHQAMVPDLSELKSASVYGTRSRATLRWEPNKIGNEKLKEYTKESCAILKRHIRQKYEGYTFFHSNNYIEYIDRNSVEASSVVDSGTAEVAKKSCDPTREPRILVKEINEDALLDELHKQCYNIDAALASIKKNPNLFVNLFTKEEQKLFDLGYARHCGSLRNIAALLPTKSAKEVVDYQYRFKMPKQFRKNAQQKMEQSRRMMVTADARQRDGAGKTGGTKKARNWTKGGATEQRRNHAKEFLMLVRSLMGSRAYVDLAQLLKQYHSKALTIELLKEKGTDLLNPHHDLLDRFYGFLPPQYR